MKILSLFDGMACGMLAMMDAGVTIDSYESYEIDKYAVKTAEHNFPQIREHGDVFKADFTEYKGIDFLVGGSPCTYWSIAQTKNRETTASGMGWELFSQYVRALKEAKPRFFIYENNKSMSKDIRASITDTFGFEPICINSALVSAQNRQRLYWCGIRQDDGTYRKADIEQPADMGILLKDVLDGVYSEDLTGNDKSYTMAASYNGAVAWNTIERSQRNMVAERIPTYAADKSRPVEATYPNHAGCGEGSLQARLCSDNPNKQQVDLIAEPIDTIDGKSHTLTASYFKASDNPFSEYGSEKGRQRIAEPIRVGTYPTNDGRLINGQANRIYDVGGKSVTQSAEGGGWGAKTGLYAMPVAEATEKGYTEIMPGDCVDLSMPNSKTHRGRSMKDKSNCLQTSNEFYEYVAKVIEFDENGKPIKAIGTDGAEHIVYEVSDGNITIRGKSYPIKLKDGYYIIRKLTVSECKRLQTVPGWYDFSCVSNTQAYKMLGNGWTVKVISHLITSMIK